MILLPSCFDPFKLGLVQPSTLRDLSRISVKMLQEIGNKCRLKLLTIVLDTLLDLESFFFGPVGLSLGVHEALSFRDKVGSNSFGVFIIYEEPFATKQIAYLLWSPNYSTVLPVGTMFHKIFCSASPVVVVVVVRRPRCTDVVI